MKSKNSASLYLFSLLSFIIPFVLYKLTSSHSLMFDDAAEFALITKLGSIAHPPGTPSFIFFGMLWNSMTSLFGMNTIDSMTLFASLCFSFSSLLLFLTFRRIGQKISDLSEMYINFCSLFTALAFATSATAWAWANTVEVYSFQVLAMAITLIGLINFHIDRKKSMLVVAALGIALGLSNHHLTMIVFLPFTPLFFLNDFISPSVRDIKKKKDKSSQETLLKQAIQIIRSGNFILFSGIIAVTTFFFYGWMMLRAQQDFPFMFGKPSTLSTLFYHVRGGSYTKNLTSASTDVISSRFPYFLKLTAMELFLLLPFLFIGMAGILKSNLKALFYTILFFFLILFLYQLKNNQWASTDAYLLLPFMLLFLAAFYGIIKWFDKAKLIFVLPLIVLLQIGFNFKSHDRRSYPVSSDLMSLLDKSAPKNSIILISDWTTVIQYYYARIVDNFRPDLVVLNYDFKFTYYIILPELYPDFYRKIQPEYDSFTKALGEIHPEQLTNTGCDLSTREVSNSFLALLSKTEAVAKADSVFFLTDPRAHVFYSQQKFYDGRRFVSGCYSSSLPGDTAANSFFRKLDLEFLKSPLLLDDPSSLDKLVDFQAMLDRHIEFYQANGFTKELAEAEASRDRILKLQRDCKKSMSFAFKIK